MSDLVTVLKTVSKETSFIVTNDLLAGMTKSTTTRRMSKPTREDGFWDIGG